MAAAAEARMKNLRIEEGVGEACYVAAKPPPGTRKVQDLRVRTNMFKLTLNEKTVLHKYNVTVELELNNSRHKEISRGGAADDYHKTQNRRRCFEAVWKTLVHKEEAFFGYPFAVLYNRWNALYTLKELAVNPIKTFSVEFVDPESGQKERCTVSLEVGEPERVCLTDFSQEISRNLVDRASCPTTKALEDLIAQPIFLKDEYFSFYRSFYKMPMNPVNLGSGRELADGFSTALKLVEGVGAQPQPHFAVQIDNRFTGFHKTQLLTEAVMEILELRQMPNKLNDRQRVQVNKALRDVAVRTTHLNRDFKIASLSHETPRSYKIPDQEVQEISVEQYFANRHKLRLRYPDLPCVKQLASGPKDTVVRYNYYPLEVCRILPNQRVAVKKQTSTQQQIMIRESAQPPAARYQSIKEVAAMVSENKSLETLGGKLEKEPMLVPARKLPLPDIKYQGGPQVKVHPRNDGQWEPGNRNYMTPGETKRWSLLILDRRIGQDQAKKFADRWLAECSKQGIRVSWNGCVRIREEDDENKINDLFEQLSQEGVDFALAIEPENSTMHHKVKLAEFVQGVQTQCVTVTSARGIGGNGSGQPPSAKWAGVLRKIAQKTNMKMRGFNYDVLTDKPDIQKWLKPFGGTMIIGCDVTHPPSISRADQRRGIESSEPSVVGFTFNTCDRPGQFLGEIRFQTGGTENVEEMGQLMGDGLKRFAKASTQNLPSSLIYYRDGVSNSQFQKVLEYEVPAIRRACASIKTGYSPKITVNIVQKRNQARMFLEHIDPKARSADQNVPVGTVVSTGITHPTTREFQLTSHRAPQGTVNSPKYIVLLDENKMTSDQLEGLTLALCFSHQIINQPTSLPEPVYASHEMAKRGKNLWKASTGSDESSSSGGIGGGSKEKIDWSDLNTKFSIGKSIFKDYKHNA